MNTDLLTHPAEEKLSLVELFLEKFPYVDDVNHLTEFSADDFDRWAVAHGLYSLGIGASKNDLNMARAGLRKKINEAAVSDEYVLAGGMAFTLKVYQHSRLDPVTKERMSTIYKLTPAAIGFAGGSVELTNKIRRVMRYRRGQLTNLLQKADMHDLTPELRAQAKQQLRAINNWAQRTQLDAQLLESDFASFHRDMIEAGADVDLLLGPINEDNDDE